MLVEIGDHTFEIHTAVKEFVVNFNVYRAKCGSNRSKSTSLGGSSGHLSETATLLKNYIAEQCKLKSPNLYVQAVM